MNFFFESFTFTVEITFLNFSKFQRYTFAVFMILFSSVVSSHVCLQTFLPNYIFNLALNTKKN